MTSYLWIFAIFDACALALVAWEAVVPAATARLGKARLGAPASIVVLVASYLLQIAALAYAVAHQAQPAGPAGVIPLPLISAAVANGDAVAACMLAIGAVQSYALWSVYRANCSSRAIAVGAAALAAISLAAPVMVSPDAYAYVSDALLGLAAYAPPAQPFSGEFAVISRWWGVPVPATPYGPLWIAAAWAVTAPFSALLAKVIALRVVGLLSLAGIVAMLRGYRLPGPVIAIAALNPGLYFQFVASAHNDIFGIALLLAGGLYVQSRPYVATALLAAGALVKLPFILFAAPLLAPQRSLLARVAMLAGAATIALAVSLLAGGMGFVRAQIPHVASNGVAGITTLAVALAAAIVLAIAFLRGRRLRSAVWLMPLVSAYTCAWYLLWSLPYAVGRRRIAAYMLMAYPFAAVLLEVKFMRPWTLLGIVPVVFAFQAIAWRRR